MSRAKTRELDHLEAMTFSPLTQDTSMRLQSELRKGVFRPHFQAF